MDTKAWYVENSTRVCIIRILFEYSSSSDRVLVEYLPSTRLILGWYSSTREYLTPERVPGTQKPTEFTSLIPRPKIMCPFSKPKNSPSTKWRGGRQCGYKSCFLLKSRRIIYIPFCRVHIEGEYIKYSVGAAQNIVIGISSKNLHIYGKWDL